MVEKLIDNAKGKDLLFIGKLINITPKEIASFLAKKGINFSQEYDEKKEYAFIVLSSMINPYEEELSYEIYDMGIKDIKLEEFESYYIENINPKSLLMSIKLKKDSQRVNRLLKIKSIEQELYLELLNLYKWEDGGVFDTDSNRDTTITFIKKFLPNKVGVNHNDVVHSPASLLEIALSSNNSKALEAMLNFPKYEVKTRGKESWKPKELKEFIATNPAINSKTIDLLLQINSHRIDALLALNSTINEQIQNIILSRALKQAKINLTKNSNLSNTLFETLLSSEVKKELLNNQKITPDRLKLIHKDDLIHIASNHKIVDILNDILFISAELDYALSQNFALSSGLIKELYLKYGKELAEPLSNNINTPKEILKELYEIDNFDIILNLAANPSTPTDILDELCRLDKREINLKLATNESTSDEYLEYFKVSNELLRAMSSNKKFIKKMENKPII